MTKSFALSSSVTSAGKFQRGRKRGGRRPISIVVAWVAGLALLAGGAAGWLAFKATIIKRELNSAARLVAPLKEAVAADDPASASKTVEQLLSHTQAAQDAAEDPLWILSSALPVIGSNFSAVTEVARSADDVANLGVAPLIRVFRDLDWDKVLPNGPGADLSPLQSASPAVSSAAHAVRASAERLDRIDSNTLLPQVAEPLDLAKSQLEEVASVLDASADAAQLLPAMLGADTPRNYLLMIQNNAETRASGGIPGALAVLTIDEGKLALRSQSSASDVGIMTPVIEVDPQQQQIYSSRLGKFMQDVNLTPDFPTAAETAQKMWEKKNGERVDGVLSVDPVALSYLLESVGPVTLSNPDVLGFAGNKLPLELNAGNVVPTLLSDVYAQIGEPKLQDAYFAGVAQEIFAALSSGRGNAPAKLAAISHAVEEGRVLVWSASPTEQEIIAEYALSGSVTGPSVTPSEFGVYFNDGTGAKMDYYVQRTAQLVKECPKAGYEQVTVRITSTNTAPSDAETSLPGYVTGDGIFGVPPGSVQTNIVAYGPSQSHIEVAKLEGDRTQFAPYLHSDRPVGVVGMRLAPGETKTVEFTFGKIAQHAEPNLLVTPTLQSVKDVVLPTMSISCS